MSNESVKNVSYSFTYYYLCIILCDCYDSLLTSPMFFQFPSIETPGYVGFANLPNQVHRKSVKKGFEFTLMVVGESGLGKSTLVNALFLTDLYPERVVPDAVGLYIYRYYLFLIIYFIFIFYHVVYIKSVLRANIFLLFITGELTLPFVCVYKIRSKEMHT